jgi:ATP-dependent protease ClpP protease subunit
MNKWYDIKARADLPSEINIYGDIGDSWDVESVTAKAFVEDLAAYDFRGKDLVVNINSYGGSVSDGLAIYNALRRKEAKIKTRIDGVAVSIASLIAMAGDTVEMSENALMMIHAPWTGIDGMAGNAVELRQKAEEVNKQADVLDTYAKAMANSYMRNGISYDDALTLLLDGQDHWYTAQEAKDAGFADIVTDALPVAAHHDLSRFKTIPAAAGVFINQPKEVEIMAKKPMQPLAAENDPAIEDEEILESQDDPTEEEETEVEEPQAAVVTKPNANLKNKILAAEKTRREEIRAKFSPFAHLQGVSDLTNQCVDDHKVTVAAAVEKLMDVLGAGMEPTGGVHKVPKVEVVRDQTEKYMQGASSALLARAGLEKHDYTNPFRAFSLLDFAKSSLEQSGVDLTGKDRLGIARAALSMRPVASGFGQGTSDFSLLLENVMHKTLLQAYNTTPDTWSRFCSTGSVSDFRDWNRYRTGTIGDIDAVNEHGEYLDKSIPDGAKEKVNVKRRGNIIQITPELIINDDMNAISNLTTLFGRAAKRTIESKVYALLFSNPNLNDGQPMFGAARGNLAAAGTIPSVDSFDAARIAMKKQKDIGSNEFLELVPTIWLGPVDKASAVRILNTAQWDPNKPARDSIPNAVNGMLSDIIDTARITGTNWYLLCNPAVAPVIEVTFLDGQREPQLAQEENFRTAGISYRVELPFGVSAVDYVGAYSNPGA